MRVGVDCRFEADGSVVVRRVAVDGRWRAVEQGRQWQDDDGRHVLVMLPGQVAHELRLDPATMGWTLHALPRTTGTAV